jgi:U5 small nuclear ribonucleoprotein component
MDDLYDEFGNYIGEAVESEEEFQQENVRPQIYNYEGSEESEDEEVNEQELMEVDGQCF